MEVMRDVCDDCGEDVWYDADDDTYCADEDLTTEHECDGEDIT